VSFAARLIVILALLAASRLAEAESARVGMLMPVSAAAATPNVEAFRQALRERGYVEGRNLVIEYRYAEGAVAPLSDFAAELVRLRVDVIVTWGTPAAKAARQVTSTIPIVIAAASDPIETGLITSLARPGQNITGVSIGIADLKGKCLDLLRELVPGVRRIAMFLNPDNPGTAVGLQEARVAARTFGMQLHVVEVRDLRELDAAFATIRRDRVGAIYVQQDLMFYQNRQKFVDFAAKSRLPAMYERREYVEAGGLIAYGVNFQDNFRRAAVYVDKILRGAKPGDLAVEHPSTFDLVINLKTARSLGLTIPQAVLMSATEVIE